MHHSLHHDHAAQTRPGTTLRWPRLYDWIAKAHFLGGEARLRNRTLELANVSAGERVLDVGCGTGTLALAAKQRAGQHGSVHAIDASAEMIEHAKRKAASTGSSVAFDVAIAQALPFAAASFDLVLCTLALHHLPANAVDAAVAEMRRVLKPGGRALIVEFSRAHAGGARLNPIVMLHTRGHRDMLGVTEEALKRAGFAHVATGALGASGMGYALAR